jgi:Mg2+ and Co2+ transporter CorA
LDAIEFRGEYFWGSEAKSYLLDLHHDNDRIWSSLQHHSELCESLENTMYTLIDNKINLLSRTFTIISFVTWPAVMLFAWYQTGMKGLPFMSVRGGAYLLFAIGMIPSFIIYSFLKKRHLI